MISSIKSAPTSSVIETEDDARICYVSSTTRKAGSVTRADWKVSFAPQANILPSTSSLHPSEALMKKSRPSAVVSNQTPGPASATLTGTQGIRYVGKEPAIRAVRCTIHAPVDGGVVMADRAYILIHVQPGQTGRVVRALGEIKQIKTIDSWWGKTDIIAVVEGPDQDALTQLVLSRIHSIDGVSQTDTHLVYRLKDTKPKRPHAAFPSLLP